jgi:hypothetical protein
MEPFVIDLTVAALAVFAVLLGYGLAASWWHALRDARPLPFFDLVREVGLSPGEAREAVGSSALAFAARRLLRGGRRLQRAPGERRVPELAPVRRAPAAARLAAGTAGRSFC